MKLELLREKDVTVLLASGPISPENFKVLRAGITKLFRDGRNKIVLELSEASTISGEVLRDLAVLNLLASELSGRIVLSGVDALTRSKIENFSKPPVVLSYETRAEAVAAFAPPAEPKLAEPVSQAPAIPAAAGTPEEPGLDKLEFRQREITELGPLRKQIEKLQAENITLQQNLLTMLMERRTPPDANAFKTRIQELEAQVSELLTATQTAPAAGAASKKS